MLTAKLVEAGSPPSIAPIEDAQYWELVRNLKAQLDAGPVRDQSTWLSLGTRIESEAAVRGWHADSFFARLLQDVDAATGAAAPTGPHTF